MTSKPNPQAAHAAPDAAGPAADPAESALSLDADLTALRRVAEVLALKLEAGDLVLLEGELGAGKSTLARALIRAATGDTELEVPSPTFTMVQDYAAARYPLIHADLYRLADARDLGELGLEEMLAAGVVVVEWPQRAPGLRDRDHILIALADFEGRPDLRRLTLTGHGRLAATARRIGEIVRFLADAPPSAGAVSEASVRHLQGDASSRSYARLLRPDGGPLAILMDAPRRPDGPPVCDGLPYSRIAHLAEEVAPFVAIAGALRREGLHVPAVHHADLERGLLLIEDLGDRLFGRELEAGHSQEELWRAALEPLLVLAGRPAPAALPAAGGRMVELPEYDRAALLIEAELLLDWYWPAVRGDAPPLAAREAFIGLWQAEFERLAVMPRGWVLRDYHSPNLIWCAERDGIGRIGIIDFQDALRGHAAYDVVSLLQDARVDVPEALADRLLEAYCADRRGTETGFDEADFRYAYALLGAQRSTKILGIFTRLARRDGKPSYLAHLPRIWRYLERNLSCASLAPLRSWYDQHLPAALRSRIPVVEYEANA